MENIKLKIAAIKQVSLVDVIGHPSFVLWFPYCNFRCPWCQNWPIVLGKDIETVMLSDIIELIEENKIYVDYVQVTGGEPTLHKKELIYLFSAVREIGLKTSLNTNGSLPDVIKELYDRGILDHIAMDVKAPLSDRKLYGMVIGLGDSPLIDNVIKSLKFIIDNVEFVELRTTFIPHFLSEEDVIKIAKEIKDFGCDERCHWVLQQFVPAPEAPDERFRRGKRVAHEFLISLAKRAKEKSELKNVYVRSMEAGVVRI